MSNDLISREAVIDDLKNWRDRDHLKKHRGLFERIERWVRITTIIKVMKLFPAVDAVPEVHAKWQLNNDGSGTCGNCHRTTVAAWDMDSALNYCPHCGAKMDGE